MEKKRSLFRGKYRRYWIAAAVGALLGIYSGSVFLSWHLGREYEFRTLCENSGGVVIQDNYCFIGLEESGSIKL